MHAATETGLPFAHTDPLFAKLEAMTKDVPGFSPSDQLYSLFLLAVASSGLRGDILEIGSWGGRSAVALGLAARMTGAGMVHCIDLFPERNDWYRNDDGTYSFRVTIGSISIGAYEGQRVWVEPYEKIIVPLYKKYNGILEIFENTIRSARLNDVVRPFRGTARGFLAAAPPGLRFRMAFIDGDHGYEAVREDIACVRERLVPGGWICFDDAFSGYEGVDRAIADMLADRGAFDFTQQLTRKLFVARAAR
jgi:predicted O-methyltransferase YrrM